MIEVWFIEAEVINYSAEISACKNGLQYEKALGFLQGMRLRPLKSDVISYSAAISACEKGAQWEKTLELLQEM